MYEMVTKSTALVEFDKVTPTIPLTLSKVTLVRNKLKLLKLVCSPETKTALRKTKSDVSASHPLTAP